MNCRIAKVGYLSVLIIKDEENFGSIKKGRILDVSKKIQELKGEVEPEEGFFEHVFEKGILGVT